MAISPAIDAAQMQPAPDDEERLFEEKFGQMAYQVFSSQFPDLVGSIVTFKVLDSDLETGSGSAAFIVEHQNTFIYVPVVLADNQLKPFDMMYVKDKDIFLPLTEEWIEEVGKGSLESLGEGVKLPDTVATDVDIRNIVVPPTTGRYSYASYTEVSPRNKLAADASIPLGTRLHKLAQGEMVAAGQQGGMPMGGAPMGGAPMGGAPAPAGGQGGPGSAQPFDPEVWSTFVEQFQRIQGTTPGAALDSGNMDLESLAKMYKSHTKTWEMAPDPNQTAGMAPAAELGMPQVPMDPNAMAPAGGMQRTAGVTDKAVKAVERASEKTGPSWGQKLDDLASLMGTGAAGGAAIGGVRAGMDQELSDVPSGMIRGAVGGAIGAPLGRAIGTAAGHTAAGQKYLMPGDARQLGSLLGASAGGFMGARGDKTNYEHLKHPFSQHNSGPYSGMTVTASDHNKAIVSMIKHARDGKKEYRNALPDFLRAAPNTVKEAFVQVLSENSALLKLAGDIYGENTLTDCLAPTDEKTAGLIEGGGGQLYVADKDTPPKGFHSSFGDAAPEAFNGVLLRGYHFKDTRPDLNLAVQTQMYHDYIDPREPGVYMVFPINGTPEPALVLTSPFDLMGEDRATYPKSQNIVRLKTRALLGREDAEHGAMPAHVLNHPDKDVERSHEVERLFVLGNGDYGLTHHLMGEQIAEIALQDSKVFKTVMTDGSNPPRSGKGMFVKKRGTRYTGTKPVELADIKTLSDGTIKGKVKHIGGWGAKNFAMDPRSPLKRPIRPRGEDIVIIPADWKWLPLEDEVQGSDYMRDASNLTYIMLDALGSMGASEIVARRAGQDMYAVDGGKTNDKKAALIELAKTAHIHASAAEAILKIAEVEGKCSSFIVNKSQYDYLQTKLAQMPGQPGQPAQPGVQPMAPTPQEMPAAPPPEMPPAMAEDPEMQGSAIDQAFQESIQDMQMQMGQLMAQMQVLQTVQERAMQIEQGGGDPNAMPPAEGMDPAMQEGMDPSMQGGGMDPSMQGGMPPGPPMQGGMDPAMAGGEMPPEAMADPNMVPPEEAAPPMPIMRTEQPSSQEVMNQINPDFLEQAGQFQQQGAFDAGALGSLAKTPSLKDMSSQYAANLEDSVDDLGRTLLTLYMQESELKQQLGDEAFIKLETQLRDTFNGLGDLTLNLTHNAAHVEDSAQA